MTSSFKLFLILYYIKQIDSKLPCVCSVIDHRGRQNVVRTSVTHSAAPRVPLLSSSVIYYCKTTWNLLVKQTHAKMESIFKVLLSLKGFFSWRKPTKLQSLQPITYQTRSKDNWLQLEERITVSKSRFIKKSFRVAVLLFSDRFQTTSKRGEKETWHTRCSRVCHWCSCLFNQTVIYITSGLSVVILYLSRLTNFTSCPSWHPFTQLTQMA